MFIQFGKGKTMKIVLENIGSISRATIKISNLTVISGENDSGKTTLSKVVYALGQATSSFRYDFQQYQEFEISNAYNQLYMHVSRYLDRNALMHNKNQESFDLNPISNIDSQEDKLNFQLIDLLNSLRRGATYNSFSLFDLENVENLISRLFHSSIFPDEVVDYSKKLINNIKQKLADFHENPPTSKFIHRALKSEFSDEIVRFSEEENLNARLELIDGEHKIFEIVLDNKEVLHFTGDSDFRISDSTLIEGPAIFQISALLGRTSFIRSKRDKKTQLAVPYHITDICSKLNGTRDVLSRMLDDSIGDDASWDLTEFYDGSISYEDSSELFKLSKEGRVYHGNNTSSGIKALAILDLLIKGGYITKNTVLILDEPETNLHPTWQKKYAKAIVNLAAKGAKILVNTHSPYMLEALKVYSDKERSELFESKFYYSCKNEGSSTFVDTHGDISIIITALSAPLYDLLDEYKEDVNDF